MQMQIRQEDRPIMGPGPTLLIKDHRVLTLEEVAR